MINPQHLLLLQGLREQMWAQSDAAFQARDYREADRLMASGAGISAAISALTTYEMDALVIQRMEEALSK
jgi:hypothetical protein